MFILMTYTPWEALELAATNYPMPSGKIQPTDGQIGFLPVYASRAAALAASGGRPELVREIKESIHDE